MKNQPLAVQIWIVFAGFMLGISLVVVLLVPSILRPFFIQDIYTRIEDAQNIIWSNGAGEIPPAEREPNKNIRSVKHIILLDGEQAIGFTRLPPSLLQDFQAEALAQTDDIQKYEKEIDDQEIYYIIRKGQIAGRDTYLISYVLGEYQDQLTQSLSKQLGVIVGFILLISIPTSMWLAKYLSRPLITIEKHVKRIADRKWHESLTLDRKDEIGRLARSIELMRERLVKQDEAQQSFLQNVSHELKTPVMVIRSYTQAIRDGIYPKGDLTSTVDVIEEESKRLERQIHNLLYLTKLDYLSTREPEPVREPVNINALVEDVVDRLRWQRLDLQWDIDVAPIEIQGDSEQLGIALENILDNQIRYADTKITISMRKAAEGKSGGTLRIWNDGEPISDEMIGTLFQPFNKGKKGKFGLGLAVVKGIMDLHHAKIWVNNEEDGVAFYLEFLG
jgi:two-component system sensor histidine kinase CssS